MGVGRVRSTRLLRRSPKRRRPPEEPPEVYSSAVSVKLSFLGAAMLGISRQAFLPAPAEDLRIFNPGDLGDLSVRNAALIEPQELFFLCLAAAAALLLTQSGYAAERAVLALALLKCDAGIPLRLA